MSTPDIDALRDALTAARPALTGEQQDAADALLAALTRSASGLSVGGQSDVPARLVRDGQGWHQDGRRLAGVPPMEEPEWPSAAVMAKCGASASAHTLHVRAPGRGIFQWTCVRGVFRWEDLIDPRPLAPDEYREHGIPMPCEQITDELVEHIKSTDVVRAVVPLYGHEKDSMIRAVLRAAGHPEVGE